jgi:hypothetical protein
MHVGLVVLFLSNDTDVSVKALADVGFGFLLV